MTVKIEPSQAKGKIVAPPSKSYAHRLLIASALAKEESSVVGIIDSDDMKATLNCISALGVSIKQENQTVILKSVSSKNEESSFYCNESGSTLRFFIPIALACGGKNTFHGTERLISRGISVYEEICKEQSITLEKSSDKFIFEGKLKSSTFNVRGDISSQFITGLLFALPLLDGDSILNITTPLESKGYVDITLDVLKQYGIVIEREENSFFIKGNQKYQATNVTVEGDMSNAAFLDAFNVLGGEVSVLGLNRNSKQADSVYSKMLNGLKQSYQVYDISNCIDLGPILFAIAGVSHGAKFTGTNRLRIKESDRVIAMVSELEKFSITADIDEDSVTIHKNKIEKPTKKLYGHNDHRIVMALSVISTICGGEIDGCQAVKKSYPNFFEDIKTLGVKLEVFNENNQ